MITNRKDMPFKAPAAGLRHQSDNKTALLEEEIMEENEEKLDEIIKSDCSDFREVFLETITSDEDNEFPELLREYKALNASGRSVIDSVFVRMCGWSVPTLIRMAEERSKK